jgi:xylose isomerase
MPSPYEPRAEHKFSFGLWTVGNPGADQFGPRVRSRRSPAQLVELLAEVGAWGVNLHDNDLVPIDANGHDQAVLGSGLQGRCLHRQ